MPFPKASRALERFTVLDLTRVRSGPTCVRQLADWGANVIKIELPPEPGGGEPLGGPREGSDFQNLHRNKRSMTLNLKAPEAVAAFKRMVKKADVVVENFRPDVKRRLGIDYPQLRKINPKLVYASISGFGQTGPYAARPGFDQIAQGMGGLMSITGLPGQGPVRVGIPIADLTAGLFCALGILVALLEREKSKQGQHVTTSLLQAQIFMLDFQGARWLIEGDVPKQAGNNHPTSIPTGVFKTADGHINIASTGSKIWARFCAAADASELLQRPEYQTAAERSKNRDALNADIERYTVKHTSAEWIERLNKAGVPCGPIYSVDQVYADPQVEHLGIAQAVKTKDKTKLRMAGQPMALSRTPSRLVARPPKLGEHTDAVLKEFGFSEGHRGAAQGERGLTDADELARMTTARGGRVMDDVTKTDKMLSRKDGRVGYVIFNNPERHNAVSLDMWAATSRILEDFAKDDEVRVVVLTGAGGKAFVSGADISKFESERATLDATKHYNATVETAYAGVQEFSKPTIAMIRGYCIGGGLGLAVCCDLRICSDNSRFAVPAAKLGLGYSYAGLRRLVDVVGPAFAREIFFTARQFDTEEARAMGLVNRVVPEAELEAYVKTYAETIAGNAPLTVKAVKYIVGEVTKDESKRNLARCAEMVDQCFASTDFIEGRRAFMEKRKPAFTGK
jgi:crotonobetainyl-CoA:carnitine CoA-transferase CaiB-like acyl-CoA transferase/enoyl-CoA hydratase/carnithine racemase